MKINELRRHVKQFTGWVIRTDGERYGSRWRTVYIASKWLRDGTQVRLRNHDAAALAQVILILEGNV